MIGGPMGHLSDALLLELVAGRLDESGLRVVDEHLDTCPDCLALTGALAGQGAEPISRVGRYEVRGELGRGAMGLVLEAYDPELERAVALKLLHAPDVGPLRERLVREARALARLSHPNVVAVYEVGEHQGGVFLAMELVRGATLRAWVGARRAPEEVVSVFHAAAAGLAAAHAQGLVHRDFKPENVLVGDDGRVRIGDFGLARGGPVEAAARPGSGAPAPVDLTRSGALVGTPAYLAPELFAGGEATPASDQFAFAVSLFEALEGRRPWRGRTQAELVAAMKRAKAPIPSRAPRRVARVVLRALSRDPAARFPSMEALERALAPRSKARTWPLVALGLAAAGVAASLALGRAPRPPDACAEAGRAASVALPRARLDALSARLGPERATLAGRSSARLATFVEAWERESASACRQTRVVGARSEELLDRETACLSRRLGEVEALVRSVEADPPERAAGAAEALLSLEPLDECTLPSALVGAEPRPRDAARAAELAALERALAEASASLRSGRPRDAEVQASALLPRAVQVGHQPFVAEVELALAASHRALGALGAADEHAARSILAAERGRADVTLARAWLERAAALGERRDGRRALEHVEHAEAVIERLGRPPQLEASSLHLRGAALGELGELAAAEVALRGALERRARALGAEHVDVAKTLTALANVVRARALVAKPRASLDEARRLFERARSIDLAELGPSHAALARDAHNLAGVDRVEGKLDAALLRYEEALAIELGALGPRHLAVARTKNSMGLVELERGDAAKALAHFDPSASIFRERAHPDLASALHDAGLALAALGRHDEALARWDEALALPVPGGTSKEALTAGRAASALALASRVPRAPLGARAPAKAVAPAASSEPRPKAAPGSYLPAPGWEH